MEEKRGEVDSITNKLILKKAVDIKIKHMLEKAFISEREVYDLVREFFKKYLGVDYEFTAEELVKELRRVYVSPQLHENIAKLLNDVSEIEHLSKTFNKRELDAMLHDFKKVVDELIVFHYDNKSFLKKVRDAFNRSLSKKHKSVLEDCDPHLLSQNERTLVKMNILLDNARRWSDKDVKKSKQAYAELIELYNSLSPERRKAYYSAVNELFSMIKSKENLQQ